MNTAARFDTTPSIPAQLIQRLDTAGFLMRCRTGVATKVELEEFLVQHYFYARNFTRYLCALIANLSDDRERMELTKNLLEEMGFGGFGNKPHAQIYREMLDTLGISPEIHKILPTTAALTATMLRLCSDPDSLVGIGALCFGAEAIVPHVYRQVLNGLIAAGFPEKPLEFFRIHIDGDDEHALTMEEIAVRLCNGDHSRRQILYFSAALMIEHRRNFFEGLITRNEPSLDEGVYDKLFQ